MLLLMLKSLSLTGNATSHTRSTQGVLGAMMIALVEGYTAITWQFQSFCL